MAFMEVRDAERLRLITGPPGGESYSTDADVPRSVGDVQRSGDAFTDWDDGWQYPTLTNGWKNYADVYTGGGTYYTRASYRKLPGGLVVVQGLVVNGTAKGVIFTLPVGYRPDAALIFPSYTASNVIRLQVNSSGAVYHPYSTSTGWHSIECQFHPG